MMRFEVAFLSLLLILSFALCGQSLAKDTQRLSDEEDAVAEEEVIPEDVLAPEEEAIPEDVLAPEGEAVPEGEAPVEEQVEVEEEAVPEEGITQEEMLYGDEEATSEGAAPPAKEMTREELLETLNQVHGKQDRRQFRAAYWVAGLEGDKRKIYDTYGSPSSRYREDRAGAVVERWIYAEEGKQFIFRDNKLTVTRTFKPGTTPGRP